jgi:hypothetical protein
MSSSGMSDSEQSQQQPGLQPGPSFGQGKFSSMLLPPIVDIRPRTKEGEVVMYSKEVQTVTLSVAVEESDNEGDDDEVKRRVEEEVQRELERLKIEEERVTMELELERANAEREVPGTSPRVVTNQLFRRRSSREY